MNNKKELFWLKLGYWAGIVVDAVMGFLLMFYPTLIASNVNTPTPMESYYLRYYGIVVFAWTFVLVFGVKKPVKRKALLLITVILVLIPFILNQLYSIYTGLIALDSIIHIMVFELTIVIFMIVGYMHGRRL